jgi:hypothetical protein
MGNRTDNKLLEQKCAAQNKPNDLIQLCTCVDGLNKLQKSMDDYEKNLQGYNLRAAKSRKASEEYNKLIAKWNEEFRDYENGLTGKKGNAACGGQGTNPDCKRDDGLENIPNTHDDECGLWNAQRMKKCQYTEEHKTKLKNEWKNEHKEPIKPPDFNEQTPNTISNIHITCCSNTINNTTDYATITNNKQSCEQKVSNEVLNYQPPSGQQQQQPQTQIEQQTPQQTQHTTNDYQSFLTKYKNNKILLAIYILICVFICIFVVFLIFCIFNIISYNKDIEDIEDEE